MGEGEEWGGRRMVEGDKLGRERNGGGKGLCGLGEGGLGRRARDDWGRERNMGGEDWGREKIGERERIGREKIGGGREIGEGEDLRRERIWEGDD